MDPALDLVLERGSKPLHVTIAEQLAAAIASGALAPGVRLPPSASWPSRSASAG